MSIIKEFFKGTALTEFELEVSAVVQLVMDNPPSALRAMVSEMTIPLTLLGEGNYGAAFSFVKYPNMVLKVCRCESDGYPEYIRQVAKLGVKRKRWMPEVLAHGGSEMGGGSFWCVLPKYDNPAGEGVGYRNVGDGWKHAGGYELEAAMNGGMLVGQFRNKQHDWYSGNMGYVGPRLLSRLPKALRRDMRQIRAFIGPMVNAGADVYMHAGNALKKGNQWIITDPIAGWYSKESFSANR